MNKMRLVLCSAAAAWSLASAGLAQADNHALIMTIDYAGTGSALPAAGLEADGRMAVKIAEDMGVPKQNIRWMRNRELTRKGMTDAMEDLVRNRVREGDKVFLFYAGHGAQEGDVIEGAKCTEAMVTADEKFYVDVELQATLQALSDKASQVVMLNNSCFAGGQATKALSTLRSDGGVPLFTRIAKSGSAADTGYVCSKPVNTKALGRSLGVVAQAKAARMLYVAGAADNEVGWMTPSGGVATKAWARCLQDPRADLDHNGIIDGDELRRCAQGVIASAPKPTQTITVVGEARLPMSFLGAGGAGNAGGGGAGGGAGNAAAPPVANPSAAFESFRAAADPTIKVGIRVNNPRLKIKRDMLDFSVTTDRDGYLYLLHLGTDGHYYLLYPNDRDRNNRVTAGSYTFPHSDWALQAQGPAGKGYLMAYWAAAPIDFSKGLSKEGPFSTGAPTTSTVRSLGVVAMQSRYGASAVAEITEAD